MNTTCSHCQSVLKPLFNVTLFCPNDCDRIFTPNTKWYSWYSCAQAVGAVVDNEIYLTPDFETIRKKVLEMGSGTKIWEVQILEGAKIEKSVGPYGVFYGGPIRLIGEVRDGDR